MKRISLLLLGLSFGIGLFAQTRIVDRNLPSINKATQAFVPPSEISVQSRSASTGDIDPIGTIHSDAVTTVKMGEASNSYSTLAAACNPLSYVPGVGTNGGSLALVYRRNINTCGGTAVENGRLTYSISTDMGQSWDVGSGVTSSATSPPPSNHCFGVIQLSPQYDVPSRYPMGVLFSSNGSTSTSDLVLSSAASLINNGQWDGNHVGTVLDPAGTPNLTQDQYPNQGVGHTISGGMVERVPGEFWYATNESQGPDNDALMGRVFVYKGIYNSTTQQTDWVQATVITPNNFLSDGTNAQLSTPNIAFSPDGMIGYIAWLGDLNGGQDSVLSPVVVETTDGGQSWGTPIEIGLQQFPEIADSLQSALFVVDSVGPMQFDTMPFATGVATTGFDLDMTVDANGVPYLFTTVGAAATVNSPVGEYTIFSGIHLMNLAFTKDQFDDWNAIYV
ncbi:MAG: hypothetical protein AAFP02_07965, partial [Bacteroidota bacterium]